MRVIPRNFLLENDTLGIFITDDVIGSEKWVKINRFTFGYVYSSVYISYNNMGNKISDETKDAIKKLRPGQEISINVSIESEGRVIRHIPVITTIIF